MNLNLDDLTLLVCKFIIPILTNVYYIIYFWYSAEKKNSAEAQI